MERNEPLEWSTIGPHGEVVLKKSTMNLHVQEDHYCTDAEYRKSIVESIKRAVADPRYIANDTTSEFDNDSYARKIYMDCELCEDKIRVVIAVVEDRVTPKQVVTYWGTSKGYKVDPCDVIYNRKEGNGNE